MIPNTEHNLKRSLKWTDGPHLTGPKNLDAYLHDSLIFNRGIFVAAKIPILKRNTV
jgi:hypothetical protein